MNGFGIVLPYSGHPTSLCGAPVLEVGKFSASQVGQALPDGWKPLTFKKIPKHTSYEVVKDGGCDDCEGGERGLGLRPDQAGENRSERVPDRPVAMENRQCAEA